MDQDFTSTAGLAAISAARAIASVFVASSAAELAKTSSCSQQTVGEASMQHIKAFGQSHVLPSSCSSFQI
jgi:hypothetical protein